MIIFNTPFSSNVFSQYFTDKHFGPEQLSDNEKTPTTKFSQKRLRDFSTGRFCAHQALKAIGHDAGDILIGQDNAPLWPNGTVGSISHSGQLTGAVVGLTSHFNAMGVDIETIGKINRDMWDILYTPAEQQFLNVFSDEQLAFYTTLLFSFKESFYKMQYPVTNTFLEFTDVEINPNGDTFKLKVLKGFDGKEKLPAAVSLQYTRHDDQVITFATLPTITLQIFKQ